MRRGLQCSIPRWHGADVVHLCRRYRTRRDPAAYIAMQIVGGKAASGNRVVALPLAIRLRALPRDAPSMGRLQQRGVIESTLVKARPAALVSVLVSNRRCVAVPSHGQSIGRVVRSIRRAPQAVRTAPDWLRLPQCHHTKDDEAPRDGASLE
jgi:hypothetical protein